MRAGRFVLITGPTREPISLVEARGHLRLEHYLDDELLAGLIVAARRYIEGLTWRALITQTWELVEDAFPADTLELGKGTLQSVTSVKYLDTDGAEQTLSASSYVVDTSCVPGRVTLAPDASWPETQDVPSAVRVRFVAGYGQEASSVPQEIRQAVLLLIAHLYEHREPEVQGTIISPLKFAVEALVANERASRF